MAPALCMALALCMLTGCAGALYGNYSPSPASASASAALPGTDSLLQGISDCIDASEGICDSIMELIDWEIAAYDESFAQRGRDGDDDADNGGGGGGAGDEGEESIEEMRERFRELDKHIAGIGELELQLNGLPASSQANALMTLDAAKEYVKLLGECSIDLKSICDYYVGLYEALDPIVSFSPPESTTGETDYSLYAGQLSQVASQSQKMLRDMHTPPYIEISHGDLVRRVDEFQAFCQDFSKSVQLSDPLRLYSCIFRLNRLMTMLGKNGENLEDDIDLQFRHTKSRMDGAVSLLRDELRRNIATLTQ